MNPTWIVPRRTVLVVGSYQLASKGVVYVLNVQQSVRICKHLSNGWFAACKRVIEIDPAITAKRHATINVTTAVMVPRVFIGFIMVVVVLPQRPNPVNVAVMQPKERIFQIK